MVRAERKKGGTAWNVEVTKSFVVQQSSWILIFRCQRYIYTYIFMKRGAREGERENEFDLTYSKNAEWSVWPQKQVEILDKQGQKLIIYSLKNSHKHRPCFSQSVCVVGSCRTAEFTSQPRQTAIKTDPLLSGTDDERERWSAGNERKKASAQSPAPHPSLSGWVPIWCSLIFITIAACCKMFDGFVLI